MALSILMGRYTPFATWYGATMVAMAVPVFFMLGFRAQYSFHHPEFTRRGFVFAKWWYITTIILNLSGQIFLILNALIFADDSDVHLSLILIMCFCICCWFYDDYHLLMSLNGMSRQQYEKGFILDRHSARVAPRAVGGAILFALSVLNDAANEDVNPTKKMKEEEEMKPNHPKEIAIDIPETMGSPQTSPTSASGTNFSLIRIASLHQTDKGLVITQSVMDVAEEAMANVLVLDESRDDASNEGGGTAVIAGDTEIEIICKE